MKPDRTTPALVLREATAADWPLLLSWLRQPHVARWWGTPAAAEAGIRVVLETPSAIARIIEWEGRAVGYAHAIDASYWGEDLPEGMPPGTWDLDIVIAIPELRGRGIGRQALDAMAAEVFGTTLAIAISVFVPVRNEQAVRAYEKAGFAWRSVWDDPLLGPQWMLLRERT